MRVEAVLAVAVRALACDPPLADLSRVQSVGMWSLGDAETAKPTFIDRFAGAGGISEGFRQAMWAPVAGNDVDPDACAAYRRNFPGCHRAR